MTALKISIIGTGYVGLVTGVCLADVGHDVVCVDLDAAKVDAINAGRAPIHEKDLPELLGRHAGRSLKATTDLRAAVLSSDITFIAVGTPFDGKVIDLQYVRQAAGQIGDVLREKPGYHVVVVKSTVVPGTTDTVVLPILESRSGKKAGESFGVGMNPEFLSEGVAIEDFRRPDRIVLGGIDDRSIDLLAKVYSPFEHIPVLRTNNRTAEMVKYASNALQATAISFANEIGNLCATLGGIDVMDVMAGVHLMKELNPSVPAAGGSPRAGEPVPTRVRAGITSFLSAGCGFGGSCFPKDVKALVAHGTQAGVPMPILEGVLSVNQGQPLKVVDLLRTGLGSLRGKRIALLGLAFKPGTDDVRESPAFPIIDALLAEGAAVCGFDPAAMHEARKVLGDRIEYARSVEESVGEADAIAIVTRWEDFRLVPELIRGLKQPPLVIDGRRLLDKSSVARYAGVGV